jgi:hypothetical protein
MRGERAMTQASNKNRDGELAPGEIWILVDEDKPDAELARFGNRKRYSADALGDRLQEFTSTLSQALSKIQKVAADFELSEVSVDARLSAEVGFELIAKAGVGGGITLTFKRVQAT